MTKLKNSFVRLRFIVGKGVVKGRQRYASTAAGIVESVAIEMADEKWENAKQQLGETLERDIHRELVHTAYLFRRHINGLGGTRSGTISSALGGAAPLSLASALPAWAPRNAQYLQRRADAGVPKNRWFNNSGWRARKSARGKFYPVDPGRLVQEIGAPMFEQSFGGINVKLERNNKVSAANADSRFRIASTKHAHIQVAKISVRAMNRITPDMLPVLRTGEFGGGDRRIPGLIHSGTYPYRNQVGQRLGPTSRGGSEPGPKRGARKGAGSIYRPTLEPFLGYFLTRSIPAAVQRRMNLGDLGKLKRA